MKLKCWLIFSLLLSSIFLHAQPKSLHALPQLLNKAKTVKEKIDILNDYADTLCLHKSDTGKILAQTALHLSKNETYHIGTGDACHSIGLTHFRRNNDSAIFYFKQAKDEYLKEYPGFEKYAFALNNISRTYLELLMSDSSLYYGRLALQFVSSKKEIPEIKNRWLMFTNGAIANAFSIVSRYDSANYYYLKAVTTAEQLGNNKMMEVYFKGLSGIQAQLGNNSKAIEFAKKAMNYIESDDRALTIALANLGAHYLRVDDFANAALMADSSLIVGLRSNVGNSIGRNYTTLGNIKMKEKKYGAALQYYKTGLYKAISNHNSKSSISHLYHKTGDAYQSVDSIQQAEQSYLKALETAEGDKEIVHNIYNSLSRLFEKSGAYSKAYRYLKLYNQYHDSVYTNEKVKIISELNTRYETEKKDQQLLLLSKDKELNDALMYKQMQQIEQGIAETKEKELEILNYKLEAAGKEQVFKIKELDLENSRIKQQEQQTALLNINNRLEIEQQQKKLNLTVINRQRNRFIFLLSGFFISGVVFLLLFNRYKLRKKLQAQADMDQQRQRISRDLHDEIGATLSGIAMYSHLVKNNLVNNEVDAAKYSVSIMQTSATEMVNKLNDMVWLINPKKESLEDIIIKLKEYAQNMCLVKNIIPDLQVRGAAASYKPVIETRKNIYLFCKEAINNAAKYSDASSLSVKFLLDDNILEISIRDDGKGFDLDSVKKGNGLENMQKRATDMGASLSIQTKPTKGCHINLKLKITQRGIE
ncbi:MAG: histidine kinase [Chitinophagaceae bacterium]